MPLLMALFIFHEPWFGARVQILKHLIWQDNVFVAKLRGRVTKSIHKIKQSHKCYQREQGINSFQLFFSAHLHIKA